VTRVKWKIVNYRFLRDIPIDSFIFPDKYRDVLLLLLLFYDNALKSTLSKHAAKAHERTVFIWPELLIDVGRDGSIRRATIIKTDPRPL